MIVLKRLKQIILIYINFIGQKESKYFGRLGYEHKENEWNKFEDVLEN
jgi:hypothetical protein